METNEAKRASASLVFSFVCEQLKIHACAPGATFPQITVLPESKICIDIPLGSKLVLPAPVRKHSRVDWL